MKIKKIISILLIIINLITVLSNLNTVKANIKEKDVLLLKGDHECDSVVQYYIESLDYWAYKTVYYVYYEDKDSNERYPAFCVEPAKEGVGTGYQEYNTLLSINDDNIVWRILYKGYMGSNYKDWNLECDDDLYSATKIAVHSYKQNINPKGKYRLGDRVVDGNSIEEVRRRGKKVLDVAENLYEYGLNGKEVYEKAKVNLKEDSKAKIEIIDDKEYYVQNYILSANKDLSSYEVKVEDFVSGTKILDSNNKEKSKFSENKFKIAIPINNIKDDIKGKIQIKNAKVKTYPIFYCKSQIEGAQSYVTYTAGYEYANINKDFNLKSDNASIEIVKIDEETKGKIEGVKFKITNSKEELIGEYVTDKDGKINVKNLKPGIIYIEEIEAPDEYVINKGKQEIELEWGKTSKIEIQNKLKTGSLKIKKIDEEDNLKYLEGVEFDLIDENKKVVKHVVTNENGEVIIKNLKHGKYELVETKTIEGYILDKTIYEVEILPGKVFYISIENEKAPKEELPKLPRTGF